MTFSVAWLRLELRRHGRSLTVLALLVAFATGAVLAAAAGARRGYTAADRLWARSLPADLAMHPNDPTFDWDAIRTMPGVAAVSTFVETDFTVVGIPDRHRPVYHVPTDAQAMRTIERPAVLDGRLADPDRVDEAVVTPNFVASYGLGVGDTVTYALHTPAGLDARLGGDLRKAAGPRVVARIVGVVRSVWFSDSPGYRGGIVPSPALYERYRANLSGAGGAASVGALVRLDGGTAALATFRADVTRVTKRTDIDVWNNAEYGPIIKKITTFDAAGLLVFALAAFVATLVLVGQWVARYAVTTAAELRVLGAVGAGPRQVALAASTGPAVAAVAGATLGVGGAVVASRWMPIGFASAMEPSPGVDVDWPVLVTGWVVGPLLVLAGAALVVRSHLGTRDDGSVRRSSLAAAVTRAGLPVPVVIGTRFALEPGHGRAAAPVRPTLIAVVGGVVGIVAVFTFSTGVSDALANPARFGKTYQLETWFGENGRHMAAPEQVMPALLADRDVTGVNDSRVGVAESGERSIRLYTYDPVGTPIGVEFTSGRMAEGPTEIVLGVLTAKVLGVEPGSRVELTVEGTRHVFSVTGVGFVPHSRRNYYYDGGWLTAEGYDRTFDGFESRVLLIGLRPGSDPAAAMPRLERATAVFADGEPLAFAPPELPGEVEQVRDAQILPLAFGVFLGVLAVGALGHALASVVRRRRRELAVLRALGMTRGQCRGVVATHATVLALIGLGFGVPLGIAVGRSAWRLVADNTPLAYHPPPAALALLLIVPAVLVVANLLAAWPARRATRLRVGDVLRAE